MSVESEHRCPICSGEIYTWLSHYDLFNAEVELMKCRNCGHGSYRNSWNQSQIDLVYGVEYAAKYLNSTEKNIQRRAQYVLDISILKEFVPNKISVLDFGCSSGGYLDSMPDGWDKSGYEVNPALMTVLKSTRPQYSLYSDVREIKDCFDLITMRGVVEHIPSHSNFIQFINQQLKVGGVLYISATPDFSSPCAVQYKSSWGQIVAPEHLHQFTPASLQILFSAAGLVMKALYHPYLGTPYENWKSDSELYLANNRIGNLDNLNPKDLDARRHPFPGNMMSVIFEKIR